MERSKTQPRAVGVFLVSSAGAASRARAAVAAAGKAEAWAAVETNRWVELLYEKGMLRQESLLRLVV